MIFSYQFEDIMHHIKILITLLLFLRPHAIFASNQGQLELSGEYEATSINDNTRVNICEKEIQLLIGRVETLEHTVAEMKGQITGSTNQIPHKIEASERDSTPTLAVPHPTSMTQTKAAESDSSTEKRQYDLALIALKDNHFDDAENKFAAFIAAYPKSTMLGNAYFWYGETFFKRNDPEKAAINYLKCYKQFPQGAKAADALLKLALSLGEMKKTKEACAMLNKLEHDFKDRPATSIKRTKDAKNKYGCNTKSHN